VYLNYIETALEHNLQDVTHHHSDLKAKNQCSIPVQKTQSIADKIAKEYFPD